MRQKVKLYRPSRRVPTSTARRAPLRVATSDSIFKAAPLAPFLSLPYEANNAHLTILRRLRLTHRQATHQATMPARRLDPALRTGIPSPGDPYASLPAELQERITHLQTLRDAAQQQVDNHRKEQELLASKTRVTREAIARISTQRQTNFAALQNWDTHIRAGYILNQPQQGEYAALQAQCAGQTDHLYRLNQELIHWTHKIQLLEEQSLDIDAALSAAHINFQQARLDAKKTQAAVVQDLQAQMQAEEARYDAAIAQAGSAFDSDPNFNAHTQPAPATSSSASETATAGNASSASPASARANPLQDPAQQQRDPPQPSSSSARPGAPASSELQPTEHRVPQGVQDSGVRSASRTSAGVTIRLPDDPLLDHTSRTRRGRVSDEAAAAIKLVRNRLADDIRKLAEDWSIHPADIRGLLGFNEEISRESNDFNRFQRWWSAVASPRDSSGPGQANFVRAAVEEWKAIKADATQLAATLVKIDEYEKTKLKDNTLETVQEALLAHEARCLKLITSAEASKGICTVCIVAHPHHNKVRAFAVHSTHTERLFKHVVKESRSQSELLSLFNSIVNLNKPPSMRVEDDEDMADPDLIITEPPTTAAAGLLGSAHDTTSGAASQSSSAGSTDLVSQPTSDPVQSSADEDGPGPTKRKRAPAGDTGRRTNAYSERAMQAINRALLSGVASVLAEQKKPASPKWLARSRTAPPKGRTAIAPKPLLPHKNYFDLLYRMGLQVEGWPDAAKRLLQSGAQTVPTGETLTVVRGSLLPRRSWSRDEIHTLHRSISDKQIRISLRPVSDDGDKSRDLETDEE
ncbi:hypothetical protein V8E36_005241 [Tilletia maclaganii]